MTNDIFGLAKQLVPVGTPEDHPFPNCTDADIWCDGFISAFDIITEEISTHKALLESLLIHSICKTKKININELRKRYSY